MQMPCRALMSQIYFTRQAATGQPDTFFFMDRYYKLDSRKVTFGEYWNIVRSPTVIIPWVAKLLNIPMRFASGLPDFDSVRQLEVPEAEFSMRAFSKLQPLLDKCLALGFHSPRFFTYESMRRDLRTSFIAMVHESGATVRLMHTLAANAQPPQEKTLVVLLSELNDGTYYFTSGQRKQFITAPGIFGNRLVGASPEKMLESHLQKMAELSASNPAKPVRSTAELDDMWDRYEKHSREFGMQRGIYVWMTPEEVAKESQGMAEVQAMSAGTAGQNDGVLLELHNLQNKKAGWGGIVALLVISLLLFVGVGAQRWSWNYLIILLAVLLVHELGHYLAMRAFNYRNLRMFFIPLFGAAVSGQNHNVPGWKKVVVSLMGPVPGIVLGIIFGVAGMALHQPWLLKVAIVSLLLNGFNLLPVLPMDGGWIFHTLIFSRHPVLDAAFRVLAIIGLMALGIFTKSKFLMYLGIPILMGIPTAYRTARIAAELKRRGLPPVPPDDQNIPAETANAIIAEIQKSSTKPQSNKTIAQQVLQIFETINAHPPVWPATVGLLFVHLASLALAAVFAFTFVVAQRGDFASLLANAAFMPKHTLACGPQPSWRGEQFDESAAAQMNTIVATFPKHAAAQSAFQPLTNQLPARAALKMFGDTLLLTLPADDDAARAQWLTNLQAATKDVFVDSTNYRAAFTIFCIAPTARAATNLEQQLEEYFTTFPALGLTPPWNVPGARISASEERARQTYLKLQNASSGFYTNSELEALEKRSIQARKTGSNAELEQLRAQSAELNKKLEAAAIQRVRSGADGGVDTQVVDLFEKTTDPVTRTNRAAWEPIHASMAWLMGQIPSGNPAADGRLSAHFGGVTRSGLILRVNWVSFNRIDEGPPALAAWLCDQGCIGIKYDFQAGLGNYGGDDSD